MGDLTKKHELMEEAREALAKTLGPTEVLALALGAIVGWGCFMLPGITFLPNAGPLGTIIAFFIGAFFQCIVALGYSFLIKPYPVAGGAFVYAYAGFGSKGAFICGWALVLSYVCVIAANATAIILLVRFLLGKSIQFGYLYTVLDWDIYLSEVGYITVILLVFGYMNFRGVDAASAVQVFLAFALTIGVLVLTIGTATAETASLDNLQPLFAENRSAIACIMMVLALTPWLYVGFDTIPQMAEEFSFSPGKARDLMLLSIICGAVIYALVTLCVAGLIPYKELLAANHDWATGWVANQIFGRWGGVALAVPVLAAILTGMNGFFMATTRLLFSMGRSKFLPGFFSEVHPKYNTAWKSVVFITALTLIVPWFGRPALDWIVATSSIGTALAYLFACLTARKYLLAHPELRESSWGKPVCTLGAITSLICIGLLMIPSSPVAINVPNWAMLFAWVALGAIFFLGKQQELLSIPHSTMRYLLFGKADQEVLFDTMEDDEDIV